MVMNRILSRLLLAGLGGLLLITAGCLKTFEIVSTEFPQAQKHEPSYVTIKEYLRSLTLYEGFETKAQFDILWMSDDICSIYAALRSAKVGHSENEKNAFLVRHLEDNKHWITFYVLSEVHDDAHISLNDKNSSWSMFLKFAEGNTATPVSIKEVDLEPEVRFLFGNRFEMFKKSYRVRFAANHLDGVPRLIPEESFSMTCAGVGMSGEVSWHIPLLQKQSVLQKKYELQQKDTGGLLSAFAAFAEPQGRDMVDDYFW
jgi:uncharacterized protein YhbP (UPF0306 family)